MWQCDRYSTQFNFLRISEYLKTLAILGLHIEQRHHYAAPIFLFLTNKLQSLIPRMITGSIRQHVHTRDYVHRPKER